MQLHTTHSAANRPHNDMLRRGSRIASSPLRRRLLWGGAALILLALLVVTPPLISANRYRARIAETMSRSLGRPVHLDAVTLHLLPVPGFTLENFVVSEDPAFGAEPTIRANTVEATLRVSSLWRRPVEFSTVRFVEPSVNLVRNAEGRWNLADVLMHASRVDSAPTAQRSKGPTPRFPYIEATGGRVNIKLATEKLPYSLTDTNFALWLPSPQEWSVRLVGSPARTDRDITDPGRLRIEGDLRRAAHVNEIPVHFRATWHDAPLGEATRILAGEDWGWRGTLNLDTELNGLLGKAHLATKLTLGGLRRAEFFPAEPLDLQLTCNSGFALHPAALTGLLCQLPDDAPEPLQVRAEAVRLHNLAAAPLSVDAEAVPTRWGLLWAALFSSRVPTDLHPTGTLDLHLQHGRSAPPATFPEHKTGALTPPAQLQSASWYGTLKMHLPVPGPRSSSPQDNELSWQVEPPAPGSPWPQLRLAATPLLAGEGNTISVAAGVTESGYSFTANGSAPNAAILEPARYLPQLADGLEKALPYSDSPTTPVHVQLSCTRTWADRQVCTGPQVPATSPPLPVIPLAGAGRQANRLAPRSLSPLEGAPFSTRRPLVQQP